MATLAEILTEVQTNVGRPDSRAAAIIKNQITAGILKCHATAQFSRDLIVWEPTFVADTTGEFSVALPSGFRALYRILAHYTGNVIFDAFKETNAEQYINYYGFKEPSTYRIIGSNLYVNYVELPTLLQVKYLAFPTIDWDTPTTNSFIAAAYHLPITAYATAKTFDVLGDKQARTIFWQDYVEGKQELIRQFAQLQL